MLHPHLRDTAEAPPPGAKLTLLVALWGMFVSNVTLTVLTVALPFIARDLGSDPALTNWVNLGPMISAALLTPAAGRIADGKGRKRTWLGGFVLASLGMLGSAIAPSLEALLLSRILTGVGSAFVVPSALAIITDLYPPERRNVPLGYWTSVVAISPLVGVLLGGMVLDWVSWRALFWGQVLLAVPAVGLGALIFEERLYPVAGRFDVQGAVALGVSVVATMLGATWLGRHAIGSPRIVGALLVAAMASLWVARVERRADNPVLPPALLADRGILLGLVARFFMNASYMGGFVILPYMLSELWGLSAFGTAMSLALRPLAMGLAGPISGPLGLRWGGRALARAGAWLITLAQASFLLLGADPNHWLLAGSLIVAGAGLGLGAPAAASVVAERVPANLLGTASSLITLTATVANSLGMAVLFAVVEGSGGVRSVGAYRAGFAVGTVVAAFGIAACAGMPHVRMRSPERGAGT